MKSTTCRFEVVDATLDTDWDDLFWSYWTSWKTPFQAAGALTFAHLGENNAAERSAFRDTSKTYHAMVQEDPDLHLLKIVDASQQKIIGGAMWKHFRTNPYRAGLSPAKASWFEKGSELRNLAEDMYTQLWSWRPRLMSTEHACGQALWILPEYRHSGAAAAFMKKWTADCDVLGLEAYLEGSFMGTPLYEQYGFVLITYADMKFERPQQPTEQWSRLVSNILAHPISIMWRPCQGEYVEGETILPWTGKPRDSAEVPNLKMNSERYKVSDRGSKL